MKLMPTFKQDYITIEFSAQRMTCAWLTIRNGQLIQLHALYNYQLSAYAHVDGALFNMHDITAKIKQFIATHAIKNAVAAIACAENTVYQTVTTSPLATPTNAYFHNSALQQMIWQAHYLHPLHDLFAFYIIGIRREQLAQYQLLALQAGLNLVHLSAALPAALKTYKKIHGTQFKSIDHANSLANYHAALKAHQQKGIAHLAEYAPTITINESSMDAIITACGLALSGEEIHEKY